MPYALRITDIDPIEHGLLFERFLNPERASMPDRVAQVITFGTIKTKAALKDSARMHYGQPGQVMQVHTEGLGGVTRPDIYLSSRPEQ